MTTIAYNHKDKQIAVDSRLTCGDLIVSDEDEKFTYDKSNLFFFSGFSCDTQKLIDAYNGADVIGDVGATAIVVSNGSASLVTFEDRQVKITKLGYNYAIGRGDEFAASAMSLGLNAKQAVEHSAKHMASTGGKIHLYDIETAVFIS